MSDDKPDDEKSRIPEELEEYFREVIDDSLEPLAPEDALENYLQDKKAEYRPSTVKSHRSRLRPFIHWCQTEQNIQNMNNLTGRHIQDFSRWRREDGDFCQVTEKTQKSTLRVFLRWCESTEAVRTGLHEKVRIPSLEKGEDVRDETVDSETVAQVREELSKYHYASVEHCVWELFAETGARVGDLRALDVRDVSSDDPPFLKLVHRDQTPLKNGSDGERHIHLSNRVHQVLDDYLSDVRPNVSDEFGREPLLATQHGRISSSTIRNYIYKWTCPCAVGQECPHGRDIDECAAATRNNQASKCPSSQSPHPVRRGYITHELDAGVSLPMLCDRVNATEDVLREHYDSRTEREKMNQRRSRMNSVHQDKTRYGR